jgi:hypothetical protein
MGQYVLKVPLNPCKGLSAFESRSSTTLRAVASIKNFHIMDLLRGLEAFCI